MGKESEVLQAAQDGNLSKLESLFTQKRFGGLLKGPNINSRDDSGCTALHLSALNGHSDVVIFLLHNDASANVPDNAGSYPLHLAAFNGHNEIANTLITRGPSRAQVNEANMAGDTPLHVAAQYGHQKVVKVLLNCHADATSRNSREESPLDLASQYGRESTVELFLSFDKTLCYKDAVHKHSPLHLAARNGHINAVRLLLDHGMPVNATCDMGTALHGAALFGKVAIAKLLLDRGIDIEIEDDNGQKVLDLLVKHPSKRAQEITALIYAKPTADEAREVQSSLQSTSSHAGQRFDFVHQDDGQDVNEGVLLTPSGYDVVPPPRPKPSRDNEERHYSIIAVNEPSTNKHPKNPSDDESSFDLATTTPLETSGHLKREKFFSKADRSANPYSIVGGEVPHSPIKSKQSIKQKRTSKRNSAPNSPTESIGNTYSEVGPVSPAPINRSMPFPFQSSKPLDWSIRRKHAESVDSLYQVPPRNSYSGRDIETPHHVGTREDNIYQAMPSSLPATTNTTHQQQHDSNNIYQAPPAMKLRSQTLPLNNRTVTTGQDIYDNVNLQNKPTVSPTNADVYDNVQLSNSPVTTGDTYDNVQLSNSPVTTGDTYDNVNITNKQQLATSPPKQNNNSSDMYYQQPPTPIVGSGGMNENVDMYYQAPPAVFKQKPTSSQGIKQNSSTQQQYTSVKTKSMKQKRTGTVVKRDISIEENTDSPSIAKSIDQQQQQQSIPTPQTVDKGGDLLVINANSRTPKDQNNMDLNLKTVSGDVIATSKVDGVQNVQEEEANPKPKPRTKMKQSRTIDRSVESGYRMAEIQQKQPLDETYEWNKIDAFLSNLEEFAGTPTSEESKAPQITNVTDWLELLGLSLYEPMLLTNGFDEINFINGCLDDQDLIELGILHSEHRKKILESAEELPKVPIIGVDGVPIPTTLSDWLKLIRLEDYANRFLINGYGNIDRVRVIWELELVTVLDINAIGHRKRMLNSLGRKPLQIKSPVSWAQRFAEAESGKKKSSPLPDDSMEVAHKLIETAKGLTIERKSKTVQQQPEQTKASNQPQAPAAENANVENKTRTTSNSSNSSSSTSSSTDTKQKGPKEGWLHTQDILLYESVAYSAQYLGSHPVQKVKGVQSTLDACSKMKVLSQNVHKMPSIVLSISVRGIDYIDSNSKMIINSYSINHISFCAQDPTNLQVFAYITRDELTRKNYCHVFKAQSTRQADEIILTLGQCFEVAYEQHLELMKIKKAHEETHNPSRTVGEGPPTPPTPYAERSNKQR